MLAWVAGVSIAWHARGANAQRPFVLLRRLRYELERQHSAIAWPLSTSHQVVAIARATEARLADIARTLPALSSLEILKTAVTSDFKHARVVDVDGWTVSETEFAIWAIEP